MISIAITDDHRLFREGLAYMLENDPRFKVSYAFSNGEDLLNSLSNVNVDVLIMDITLPGMDGIAVTRQIIDIYPGMKILALTMIEEKEALEAMLEAGAIGYHLKDEDIDTIKNAIIEVNDRDVSVAGSLVDSLSPDFRTRYKPGVKELSFTKRELEIIELILEGLTSREIAEKLFISKRTVDRHREKILHRAGVKNTGNLISMVYKNNLLSR